MTKKIVDWTYTLQYKLDQMTEMELVAFETNHVIRLDGKLWGKNEQGKNSKTKRKTNRAAKNSSEQPTSV